MEDKVKDNKREEVEIDIQRVIGALWQRLWLIILTAIIAAVISLGITHYLITPLYESSALFYVNNTDFSVGDASLSITSSDITASKSLVDSYIVILSSRETLLKIIDYAEVDRTYEELERMISAAPVNSTEIFEIVVTSPDPTEAEIIANAIAYILPNRISGIIDGTSAKVVDSAVRASAPSSPSYPQNVLIGFVIGFIISAAIVVLQEVFDITIRVEEDITSVCRHPILASVPDMSAASRGGYYYYSDKKKRKNKPGAAGNNGQPALIGGDISFSASEAYKLLRTKLQFSFTDENRSRVIGLSSALSGEGKSLTAVNLAYTLSQLDKRVLLIDCDMRRPTLAEKLGIQKKPGLSSYLTSQSQLALLIQKCGIKNAENAFDVITAGENPPNPIELLSSVRMANMLHRLREIYDYIILDLPPVGEVSDAMAVANHMDGMLLVVRQNYCNRIVFSAAVRQFEFVDARILGIVYNGTTEDGTRYGRYGRYKGYYRRYYRRYYKSYGDSYANAMNKTRSDQAKAASQPRPPENSEAISNTINTINNSLHAAHPQKPQKPGQNPLGGNGRSDGHNA